MISVFDKTYNLQYGEPYSGAIFMSYSDEPFFSLEDALSRIFSSSQLNYNFALLTIGCKTVAILKISDVVFKVFDSHSRDSFGMPHSFGKCVLLSIVSIHSLAIYFQTISTQVGGNLPFEIKGVSISFNAFDEMAMNTSSSESELNQSCIEQVANSQRNITTEPGGKTLTKKQLYDQKRLQNETPEQREKRLSRKRELYKRKQHKENDPSEIREERLSNKRRCNRQRLENETPDKKEERL
jgi:hypothetical protein